MLHKKEEPFSPKNQVKVRTCPHFTHFHQIIDLSALALSPFLVLFSSLSLVLLLSYSDCQSVCLCVCLSVCLAACPLVFLTPCLPVCLILLFWNEVESMGIKASRLHFDRWLVSTT